jgi:hypothetical protein
MKAPEYILLDVWPSGAITFGPAKDDSETRDVHDPRTTRGVTDRDRLQFSSDVARAVMPNGYAPLITAVVEREEAIAKYLEAKANHEDPHHRHYWLP